MAERHGGAVTGAVSVHDLAVRLSEEKNIGLEEAARLVYLMNMSGEIRLLDPYKPQSIQGYLFSLYSAWYWLVLGGVLLQVFTIYVAPQTTPFTWVRVFAGFMMSLYLPGYTFIEALYPQKGELEELERFALSVGLSLALTPLTGFLLNYTPWGIRLDPVLAAISLLTLGLGLVAVYRKYTYYLLMDEMPPAMPADKTRVG